MEVLRGSKTVSETVRLVHPNLKWFTSDMVDI